MFPFFAILTLQFVVSPANVTRCTKSFFALPDSHGLQVLNIEAIETFGYHRISVPPGSSNGGSYTIDFCNVTVTYTHPGWNDKINVNVWLPLKDWNRRLWALGGGGYSASFGSLYQTQAVAKGYVALGTDSGHTSALETAQDIDWALAAPGNVNLPLIEDWGYRTLGEMTEIGKNITMSYYSSDIAYSYFSGCSGGGRQAMMISQRFPEDYDGILAAAPAIKLETFIPAGYWAQQTMKDLDYYPSPCEIESFTNAAIEACDMLDGPADGIISSPWLCNFTAGSVVGKNVECNGTHLQLTSPGARIVQAAWDGYHDSDGKLISPGLNFDANLTSTYVSTKCSADGGCTSSNVDLLANWFRYLIVKDPTFNISQMSNGDFARHLRVSRQEFSSALSASDPDLSAFRDAGGKMIVWHGGADEVIPTKQSEFYFDKVLEQDSKADEYVRFFEAPGVGHCVGGLGPAPGSAFDQLVQWVENSTIPETLDTSGKIGARPLCRYPLVQKYIGNDASHGLQFSCVEREKDSATWKSGSHWIANSLRLFSHSLGSFIHVK